MRATAAAACLAMLSASAPASAAERASVSLGFGWISPVADPNVSEGYGGGSTLFVRFTDWLGGRISFDVTHHDFQGALAGIPYPYTNGDIVFGPVFEVTGPRSPVAVRLFMETGAYWSSYIIGLAWTWGLDFGSTLLWRITDGIGVQAEMRYHLYNLGSVGDQQLLCPQTLRPLGVVDRLDLVFGFVMAI
jgi:hypothetical protein